MNLGERQQAQILVDSVFNSAKFLSRLYIIHLTHHPFCPKPQTPQIRKNSQKYVPRKSSKSGKIYQILCLVYVYWFSWIFFLFSAPDMNPHLNNRTELCNEDCLNTFVKQLQTEPDTHCREVPRHVELMYMMACHSLLSDLMTTKYERFFQPLDTPRKHHPGLWLHLS